MKSSQKRTSRHGAQPYKYRDGWRIAWVDLDRKRRFKNFPSGTSFEAAAAELARIKGELQAVKDGLMPRRVKAPLFSAFVAQFWDPNRTAQKRSAKDDRSIMRAHLLPAFGSLPLDQISTRRVEHFRGELLGSGLNPKTVRNILALLGAALHYALELELIQQAPIIRKPRIPETDYKYLSTEGQVRALLSAAEEEGPAALALYGAAVYSGMRLGELCGLLWADVDFTRGLITVRRSYDKPTKSGRVRHVPILDVLAPILRAWRLRNPGELVFPTQAGTMRQPSDRVSQEVFHRVLDRAGLPRMTFHCLRHSFASLWAMKGGDFFALQRVLGHSTPAMTARYSHLCPEMFTAFRGLFGPPAEQGEKIVRLKKAEGEK